MRVKTISFIWIILFLNETMAGPYSFRTVNGKNELVIDDDYLESKKEMELRKLKEAELKKLKAKRKKRRQRKLRKKRRKLKIKSNKYHRFSILLFGLKIPCVLL